ncbi:HAD family hydrolase [Bythopirellula polymerisocia]|uniref:phosphoglycolate phosphatase n=1 Tax=Bythopirellula polymerisocia TaxID=2528003 RepID=A0A5C6CR32_9BACT|nr:HAD hydrolase-like protein [Bythopirellula polymerisocia]TWU25997.1 Phosphoglycolate phosphatase [Bythopirellula polymerisocia]
MVTVLFDIDGTLIQTGGAGQRAFAETFSSLFGIEKISSEVRFAGRSDRAIVEDLMEAHGVAVNSDNWNRFIEAMVPRLVEMLPLCQGTILPGVVELLDELEKSEHVATGLLTGNIAAGARAKLSHYQLWQRFAFGGYGDHCTNRNDIAAAALAAAQSHVAQHRTGNSQERSSDTELVFVIGDTPADVECARSIGACAIAVLTGGASREQLLATKPDLLLNDLTEVDDFLLQINAAVA